MGVTTQPEVWLFPLNHPPFMLCDKATKTFSTRQMYATRYLLYQGLEKKFYHHVNREVFKSDRRIF